MQGLQKRPKANADIPSTASLLSLPSDLRKVVLGKIEDFEDLCIVARQNNVLRRWMWEYKMLDYWLSQHVGPDPALRREAFWFVMRDLRIHRQYIIGEYKIEVDDYAGVHVDARASFPKLTPDDKNPGTVVYQPRDIFHIVYRLLELAGTFQVLDVQNEEFLTLSISMLKTRAFELTSHKQWLAAFLSVQYWSLYVKSRHNVVKMDFTTHKTFFRSYRTILDLLTLGLEVFSDDDENLTRPLANGISSNDDYKSFSVE